MGEGCSLRKGGQWKLGLQGSSDKGHRHGLGVFAVLSVTSETAQLLRLAPY